MTVSEARVERRRPQLATAVAWIVLAILAGALCAVALAYDELTGASPVDGFSAFAVPLAAMALVTGTVGLAIRRRRPTSLVGALMGYGPVIMLSAFAAYAAGAWRMVTDGPGDTFGGLAATWGAAAVIPGILVTFPAVAIVFPDGRLPSRRWRLPVALVFVLVLGGSVMSLVSPTAAGEFLPENPLAIPGVPTEVAALATTLAELALVAAVILAVAAVLIRFLRSDGIERQQLKWLASSVAVAGILFPISFVTDIGPAGLIDIASLVAVGLIPVTIGVAILRYRLYDIDRLISRSLSWAVLSALLIAVYAGGILVLQDVLGGVTQGETLAVAASTLLAVALFHPFRRRVQGAMDRRFDRARYDGERTAAAFGERLRDEVDMAGLEADISATIGMALKPRSTAVWIRNVRKPAPSQVS